MRSITAYTEHLVPRGRHRIYARQYEGTGPTIVLMHGFPDNLHLYDRLAPCLAGRRIVAFDFLGWGGSDKPADYPYTADNQTGDLDAVIEHLGLDRVVLVAHDASGPPAIDWALAHPEHVAALVLLNTYYCRMPSLRPPEAILLYSTPLVRAVARLVARRFDALDRKLYTWQVGRFVRDPVVRAALVPGLYAQFRDARPAFWGLNADLLRTIWSRTRRIPELSAFDRPVRIIFGAADPYLNQGVARRFHELFPASELFLLPGARHYVQVDEPDAVARLIRSVSLAHASDPDDRPTSDASVVVAMRGERLHTSRTDVAVVGGGQAGHPAPYHGGRAATRTIHTSTTDRGSA